MCDKKDVQSAVISGGIAGLKTVPIFKDVLSADMKRDITTTKGLLII